MYNLLDDYASDERLNERQKVYIGRYLVTLNATEAALYAGYECPQKSGYAVRRSPLVSAYIERAIGEMSRVTESELLARLGRIARQEWTVAFEVDGPVIKFNPELAKKLGVTTLIECLEPTRSGYKVKFPDCLKATELLLRALGKLSSDRLTTEQATALLAGIAEALPGAVEEAREPVVGTPEGNVEVTATRESEDDVLEEDDLGG